MLQTTAGQRDRAVWRELILSGGGDYPGLAWSWWHPQSIRLGAGTSSSRRQRANQPTSNGHAGQCMLAKVTQQRQPFSNRLVSNGYRPEVADLMPACVCTVAVIAMIVVVVIVVVVVVVGWHGI